MAKANLKLATPPAPPQRTPERQDLADSIQRRANAERRVVDAEDALRRCAAARIAATNAVDDARAALEEATATEPARVAAEFLGKADDTTPSVESLRAEIERASTEHARLQRARPLLEQEQRAATSALENARRAVERCAQKVVQSEHSTAELLTAAQLAQQSLINMRVILHHLLGHGLVPEAEGHAVWDFLVGNTRVLPGAPPYGGHLASGEYQDWDKHAAVEPWREAVARLAVDADAPLPGD